MKKILFTLIVLLTIITGCTNDKLLENTQKPLAITTDGSDNEIIERSEMISDGVVELYGIDDAASIILNDEVLIGVKVAYDEKLKEDTITSIESKVKTLDENITKVYITDKSKQFNEINNIITEILQGESYENFIEDIDNLKNRMK